MHYMIRRRTDNLIYISKKPIQQPIWAPYGAHMVLQHKILHPKIVVKIINLTIESVKRVFTLAKTCMETISNSVHFVRSLKIIITCVFQRILTLKVMLLIIVIISKIFGKSLLPLYVCLKNFASQCRSFDFWNLYSMNIMVLGS